MGRFVSRSLNLRLNRRYFWLAFAVVAGGTIALAQPYPWVLNGGFVLPWSLLHAWRLHDFGRSGIWGAIAVSVFLALLSSLAMLTPPTAVYALTGLAGLLALASFTLWVGTKRGDAGANRFGPAPSGWSLG